MIAATFVERLTATCDHPRCRSHEEVTSEEEDRSSCWDELQERGWLLLFEGEVLYCMAIDTEEEEARLIAGLKAEYGDAVSLCHEHAVRWYSHEDDDGPALQQSPSLPQTEFLIYEGWSHIFSEREGDVRTRWVLNSQDECVAAQYFDESSSMWRRLGRADTDDLADSITRTNCRFLEEIMEEAEASRDAPDETAYLSTTLPGWAR